MVKVITYGTYDLLHSGHIRLLERAKALGDYLIVGVTSDAFDRSRGKINVQQPLIDRLVAVQKTGLADKIIVEEYEGQKIDDIKKYGVDIFTVGSDWKGHFDYLSEFCRVVYLDRTEGISSSDLRTIRNNIKIGVIGDTSLVGKYINQSRYVNGIRIEGVCTNNIDIFPEEVKKLPIVTESVEELKENVDACIVASHPASHYSQIKNLLSSGKHVLCESPVSLSAAQCQELFELSNNNNVILYDSIKTAYATAYDRMILLAKGGRIGEVVSVDAVCTSLTESLNSKELKYNPRGSLLAWGPTAMLPVFQLLGDDYTSVSIATHREESGFDDFSKVNFTFNNAVASILVGKKIKAEGELVVAGTKGYIYVPAPWWKTDYFEIRYENAADNRRYYFQLEGEGIRNELASFLQSIKYGVNQGRIAEKTSISVSGVIEQAFDDKCVIKV